MTLNKIVIGGNLVRDPELRQTPDGVSVCTVSVAVNRMGKDEKTDFFKVVLWRGSAEYIARYGHQGDAVVASGRMHSREWEDKQGVKRTTWEIAGDDIAVVGSRSLANASSPVQNQPYMPSAYTDSPSVIPGVNAKGGRQMQFSPPTMPQFEEIPNDEGLPF